MNNFGQPQSPPDFTLRGFFRACAVMLMAVAVLGIVLALGWAFDSLGFSALEVLSVTILFSLFMFLWYWCSQFGEDSR